MNSMLAVAIRLASDRNKVSDENFYFDANTNVSQSTGGLLTYLSAPRMIIDNT